MFCQRPASILLLNCYRFADDQQEFSYRLAKDQQALPVWGLGAWPLLSVSDCLFVCVVVPFACAANAAAELFGSRSRWADLDMDEVQT